MTQPATLARTDSTSARVPVTVMVFTLDEEIHLPSCLASLAWADDVIVVDSFSTDRTEEIAQRSGARFFAHEFTGFGSQRNWAIDNTAPRHPWILVLDADERATPELAAEIARVTADAPPSVAAFRVKRRFYMWGRWLRYSSLYPNWVVRLIHRERVRYVDRGHAETQTTRGEVRALENDLIDENLKGLDEWFARQNRYSSKEAERELGEEGKGRGWRDLLARDPLARRDAIKRLAWRAPARPLLYFIYSYLVRGGFRDGADGLRFCAMKAMYQGMINLKKHDLRRAGRATVS